MSEISDKWEKIIWAEAERVIDYDSMFSHDPKLLPFFIDAINDRDNYEPPIFIGIDTERSKEVEFFLRKGDVKRAISILEANGVVAPNFVCQQMTAGIVLYSQGLKEMAELVSLNAMREYLRDMLYPEIIQEIEDEAYRSKLKDAASKPRNQHYDNAIRILKRTWEKYPGAPKKSLFKAVKSHFNGGVSEDSLRRWASAEGVAPKDVNIKKTSFSLVLD